jgi:DnaK suppressor protein
METASLEHYREKLLKRKSQILLTVGHLQKENQELIGTRQLDWLDQAADANEFRLLDRLNEGYLRELGRIEMAQHRMASGTYGQCLACHEPIGKARLETFPETEFCLECQELRERFERAA